MTRPAFDPSLYLVLDPALAEPLGFEETLHAALAGGVSMVQLRDKHASRAEFVRYARRVRDVLGPRRVPLIINDRVDVALEVGAEGVHVGQTDMGVADVRARLGAELLVGLSLSHESEIEGVDPARVDYVGVGPIFPTATKLDTPPALGLESLRRFKARLALPLVAIGGIHAGNAAHVIQAGADGVAVVSAICGSPDPEGAARTLAREIERARSTPR